MKQSRETIEQRHRRILELLMDGAPHSTNDLAAACGTSAITIRRDLAFLAEKNLIEKRHSTAIILQKSGPVAPFSDRALSHNREKELIGTYAAKLVPQNGVLFCNSGTTVLEVIKRCRGKNITVISNNASISSLLQDSACEFICTGGEYSDSTKSYVGEYATFILQKSYANICILGVNGVSATYGLTTASSKEPMINELMIRRCRGPRIVVAAGHKVGITHCFTSVPMTEIDMLVTDSTADSSELARIREMGIEVILADRI